MQQVSLDTQLPATGPLFFSVSIRKLAVMCIVTFGLYEAHWFYQNWKAVQERTGKGMSPFWRGVFATLWCRSLFATVEECAVAHGVKLRFDPAAVAVVWFGLNACWRLPDPFWLVSFLSFGPLVLVQLTCNDLNRTVAPQHPANDRFSVLNIIGILLGGVCLIIVGIEAFRQH